MKRFTLLGLIFALLLGGFPPQAASAFHTPAQEVRVHNQDFVETSSFSVPLHNDAGGFSIAAADLGDDGMPEIILGNGIGNEPRVRILRQDGSEIGSFLAYEPTIGVGINVIACDVDGDQVREIVTVPQRRGGPHVRVFSNTGDLKSEFFAYNPAFRGGVQLACGQLDSDPAEELVTLPGPGGGPHVRIWESVNEEMVVDAEFFAFDTDHRSGLVATVIDGDLIISEQHATTPTIKRYRVQNSLELIDEMALTIDGLGVTGLFPKDGDVFLTTAAPAQIYNTTTGERVVSEHPTNSLVATSADLANDGTTEVLIAPSKPIFSDRADGKYILIDLSKQRLLAYEEGNLMHTFPISAGKYPFATPVGEHSVLAKVPFVHYRWSYGPNDSRNYDLGVVQYNLRIFPHIYIHYAYWHNNFGHPMSHGCVNVSLDNMKWVYEWADEGIPVTVKR